MSIQSRVYESFIDALSIEDLETILAEKKAKENKQYKVLKRQTGRDRI